MLAVAGGAIAVALGAPVLAALAALIAGALAIALLPRSPTPPTPAPAEPETPTRDTAPGLAELLRAMDEPMLLVRDRRVTAANDAARALLGAHIEGEDVRLAIRHPAAAEQLSGPRAEGEGGTSRTELIGLGEDPGRAWAMIVSQLSDGSRLVRLTDLSQLRAAEQMRADFVANASHELRTPLATILGFIETLQDPDTGGDAETRDRFLRIMLDEATRMRGLVDDLMSLSRIEADRFAAPRDPIDVVPVIEDARASLSQPIAVRGATLAVERETESTLVLGDRAQLVQLFSNLIANALKYGRADAPVRVRIEDGGGDLLRISVVDEGEGIAPEHLPRLTERFYRVDAGRSRAAGGTGLGLAIVKHIVLRHRGRLDIRSTLGVGTEVRVDLPRAGPLSSKSHAKVTQAPRKRPSRSR